MPCYTLLEYRPNNWLEAAGLHPIVLYGNLTLVAKPTETAHVEIFAFIEKLGSDRKSLFVRGYSSEYSQKEFLDELAFKNKVLFDLIGQENIPPNSGKSAFRITIISLDLQAWEIYFYRFLSL